MRPRPRRAGRGKCDELHRLVDTLSAWHISLNYVTSSLEIRPYVDVGAKCSSVVKARNLFCPRRRRFAFLKWRVQKAALVAKVEAASFSRFGSHPDDESQFRGCGRVTAACFLGTRRSIEYMRACSHGSRDATRRARALYFSTQSALGFPRLSASPSRAAARRESVINRDTLV